MKIQITEGPDLSVNVNVDIGLYCEIAEQIREREWIVGEVNAQSTFEGMGQVGRNCIVLYKDKLYFFDKTRPEPIEIQSEDLKLKCVGPLHIAGEELEKLMVRTINLYGIKVPDRSIYDPIPSEAMIDLKKELGVEAAKEVTQDKSSSPLKEPFGGKEQGMVQLSYKDCFKELHGGLKEQLSGVIGASYWPDIEQLLIERQMVGPNQDYFKKMLADDAPHPKCLEVLQEQFIELLKNSIDEVIKHLVISHQPGVTPSFVINVACALEGEKLVVTISDNAGGFSEGYIKAFNERDEAHNLSQQKSDSTKKDFDKRLFCGGGGFGMEAIRTNVPEMVLSNVLKDGKMGAEITLRSPHLDQAVALSPEKKDSPRSDNASPGTSPHALFSPSAGSGVTFGAPMKKKKKNTTEPPTSTNGL